MKTNKALQFLEPQKAALIEIEKREPADNEVGIKMLATSLCNHSELRSYYGGEKTGYGVCYPMQTGEPGHEGIGIIDKVGKSVTEFIEGDYVVMTGHGGEPVHRSYIIREAKDIAKILPGQRNSKYASILEMYGCAYHCIKVGWNESGAYDNKRVALIGAGAIGLCGVQILKLWPLKELIVFDISDEKLQLAKKSGADSLIKLLPDAGNELKNYGKFDIVIECSGSRGGQELANTLMPKTLINVSYYSKPLSVNQSLWFNANTTIYNPGFLNSEELRSMAVLYNRGLIDPEILISKVIKPDADIYLNTIKEIEKGKIVKAIIDWELL
jgi:threonine dehydrogenase-like Zn-dependent dehydrogenase